MPVYEYECKKCGIQKDFVKPVAECSSTEKCHCGGIMTRIMSMFAMTGTRDNFGIGKEFRDDSTGKVIDNWNSWEKAGYKNPIDCHKDTNVKEGIKRKIEKITKYDTKKRQSFVIGA